MPNSIKYSASAQTLALKKGNFWIGTGDSDKGPTSTTSYYNGITPPSGGYTIYLNKASGGPSIVCPPNDASLIYWTNGLSVASNFLTNGNFSTGTTTPWESYSDAGGVYQIVSISGDKPYAGSTSTYAVEYNYNAGMYRVTTGLLTVGVTYTFSFWGKVTSGTSMAISWNNQNGSGDTNSWIGSATITTSWQRYTQSFTYSAAKDYFFFSTRNQTVGTKAIFTEFTVTEGGAAGGPGLTTAAECLNWFATVPTDKMVFNIDYPAIVTNGLVLNLDAGFTPSYPTTGTTWYDVGSGGNNGSLINGPTFSSSNVGSVVFDGVDDYVNLGNTNISIGTGDMSVSIWVKPTAFFNINAFFYSIGSNQTGFYGLGCRQNGQPFFATTPGGQISVQGSVGAVQSNIWCNLVGTRINGTIRLYFNGADVGSSATSSGTFNTTNAKIGTNADAGSEKLQGNCSILSIYTVGLTAAEVAQNYNATKSRFGL